MRVKNLTPFPCGARLTARRPPQKELCLAVRGAFALRPHEPLVAFAKLTEQGPMRGEEFLPDDDDRRGEAVYPDDFADYKLRGEVLLRGACHTPGGRPMKECPVRFSVGSWSKLLRASGARVRSDGLFQAATEPMAFVTMPLDHAHAFGGPGYARNPAGKGHGMLELPNLEPAAPGASPETACFGPVSSGWPQRAGKVGAAYGAVWRKTRAPFFAEDFDWSYFNAAPPDQWLPGYLRGDEEVSFQNLHPGAALFSVKLPGLRLRAFVKDDRLDVRELTMVLDTLFAAPDEGRLLLTWRGHTQVREDDFADVATLFVASDPLAEEPLPLARYRDLIDAFEKDPLGREAAIDEHVPAPLREAARKVLCGASPVPARPPEGTPPGEAMARLLQDVGGVGPELADAIRAGLEKALGAPGPGAELGAALGRALSGPRAPAGGALAPGMPAAPVAEVLQQVASKLEVLKQAAGRNEAAKAVVDRLEGLLAHPRLQQLAPGYAPPGVPAPPPLPEPGPGVDCSGRDLSQKDFSGLDLSGANFSGCNLSGSAFRKTRLTGANLTSASLARADLDGATLDGADLSQASLMNASAREASFAGAILDRTVVRRSLLAGAVLDGARAKKAFFAQVDLGGARARGVRFHKVVFQDGGLEGADLSESELTECYFIKCRARGLVARGASVSRTSFAGCDLTGAKLEGLRGERSLFQGTLLDRADFTRAVLPWAFFIEAAGVGTRFYGANLKGSRFYRARLEQADLELSNLFGADFAKARLTGSRFRGANLYDAKFLGSACAGIDLEGANLVRALFERS